MSTKIIVAATAVTAVAAAMLLSPLATMAQAEPTPVRQGEMRRGPSAEDAGAFLDARIAGLKAGLRLTAEQDKAWPAFEQAYRDLAKQRIERRLARQDGAPADPVARLSRRADDLSARGAALKRLADATAPLYQSLDDAQKQRFTVLARLTGPRHGHRMMQRGMRDGPGRPDGWNRRDR